MKRTFFTLTLLLTAAFSAFAHQTSDTSVEKTRKLCLNQVLVKLEPSFAEAVAETRPQTNLLHAEITGQVNSLQDLNFLRRLGNSGWTVWEVPGGVNITFLIKSLRSEPGVITAQPQYIYPTALTTPNDGDWTSVDPAGFRRLWHLDEVNAFNGWSEWPNTWYTSATKLKNAPKIAIIDTGIDQTHSDFINAGGSSTDVQQGGQLDLADSGSMLQGVYTQGGEQDLEGHGTHVSGIAFAAGNNGTYQTHGVIGIGYPCVGFVINVFGNQGGAYDSDLYSAMTMAADKGASVENLSLGGVGYDQVLQDAVNYAFQEGTLVCCSAGNNHSVNTDFAPAASSSAMGVAANGPNLAVASYSNAGPFVSIAAPGGAFLPNGSGGTIYQFIWSTTPTYALSGIHQYYDYLAGTSMSCPVISGAAGLFCAATNLHQTDGYASLRVYQSLQRTAIASIYGNPNGQQGFGDLDVNALLQNGNPRGDTSGGFAGVVYVAGVNSGGAKVVLTPVGGGSTYSTNADSLGYARLRGIPAGVYDANCTVGSYSVTRRIQITAGCDLPGVDFWLNASGIDPNAPTVGFFNVPTASTSSVTLNQWGYAPFSTINSLKVRIGSTSGGTDVMADTLVPTGSGPQSVFNGLSMTPGSTYYVQGTYTNGSGVTKTVTTSFTLPAPQVSGTITLSSWLGGPVPVTVQVRTAGTTTVLQTFSFNIAASGTYSITWTGAPGTYDVAIKGSHWLRSVIHNVSFSGAGQTGVNATLLNGDVNGDNVVNATDYGLIKRSYLATPTSSNWNPNADLNGDKIVNASDYAIVKRSYLHHGDQ